MKPLFIINDLHLGAIRSGGTTPASALRLRQDLLFGFKQLLEMAKGCDVLVNGDLFDTAAVPLTDMFAALQITSDWLHESGDKMLWLPPGNHDLSKNRDVFSSFDFFTCALQLEFAGRVRVPRELTYMGYDRWVVPHMPNQDLFELELSKVPACEYLFVHCNYDNGFATKSDHSLNLSEAQAQALINRGVKIIVFGHEHQFKTALGFKVLVAGNQMPSSVADCLGNDSKVALRLNGSEIEYVTTWEADGSFTEIDWALLQVDPPISEDFIRVIGSAQPSEASAVVQTIAKFRQRSTALVVTNAVQIAGMSTAEMEVSLEQIQNFNVMAELLAFLDEDQRAVVTKLLAEVENV